MFEVDKEAVQLIDQKHKVGLFAKLIASSGNRTRAACVALHKNPAMHGSRMVIFLHDYKKALF